jgi:hypothetical protein
MSNYNFDAECFHGNEYGRCEICANVPVPKGSLAADLGIESDADGYPGTTSLECPEGCQCPRCLGTDQMTHHSLLRLASLAYQAYKSSAGGHSLITGHALPDWADLPEKIQLAWVEASRAVAREIEGDCA